MGFRDFVVFVKRWQSSDRETVFQQTPYNRSTTFDRSNNGEEPYIAIINANYKNNAIIIVGNDSLSNSPSRRKRRSTGVFRNAPLQENTEYAIFVRVFYSTNKTVSLIFKKKIIAIKQ